ncbi:hypothetical protein VHEMI01996 [[Torrubiella] hemipterigena]|uniref:F-box domain-containing protein n=1 Tax=[Torrubiella] hemipterigena TaxID=1531966 RepID=A0A0A1T941_9HYPO|nr:hypothetical protein VHEMI01996 [[Torrubiella] hemipterigena]
MQAMRLCPCNRGMKRDRCTCKNFQDVAAKNGSIFKEAMYNCRCTVGKTFSKCDNAIHLQALDYRAATFEVMKHLDRARRDAEWMLELAPRLPDGYLRLGKIARLQKDEDFAWKIYNAGIDISAGNVQANHKKIQQLYAARQPLQIRFSKKDPFELPPEILQWILQYCDLITRVRCLRVSKTWNYTLSAPGNASLWRVLEFTGRSAPKVSPRNEGLRKLGTKAGNDIRRLVIPNAHTFGLMQSKFATLLNGAKNLEYLEIGHVMRGLDLPKYAGLCKTLQSLKLSYFDPNSVLKSGIVDIIKAFPHSFLQNTADVLQHLDLNGIPLEWFDGRLLPEMKALKTLRLRLKSHTERSLSLMYIATNTPNLEQIWLDEIWLVPSIGWGDEWDRVWTSLKAITVVASGMSHRRLMPAITVLTSVNRGENLRSIDLSFSSKALPSEDILTVEPVQEMLSWDGVSAGAQGVYPRLNDYRNLESIRLHRVSQNPTSAHRIVHESIRTNKLSRMDIVFPAETFSSVMGSESSLHLAQYEWLRGTKSIKQMGIFGFRFRSFPRNDDDLPLPSFLASFPNLEEVELGSDHYEDGEFCTVIAAVLKATKLKRLYQSQVRGVMMDRLPALGRAYGVEIVYGERPRPWPVSFDGD